MPNDLPKTQQRAIRRLRDDSTKSVAFRNVLREAASKGWAAVLEEGFRIRPPSKISLNRLLLCAVQSPLAHNEAIEVMLDAGANPNAAGAIAHCAPDSLPLLVRYGGKLNQAGESNPLLHAIIHRTKQDKALKLIELGADVHVADAEGVTAVMHAAALGRNKTFDALVRAGADLYAIDHSGRSVARHIAESLTGGTHLSTESDRRNARRIARELRRMLPAQPEDQVLLTIALGDTATLEKQLKKGLDPDTMITGGIGLIGVSMEELRQNWAEQGGLARAIEDGTAFPSSAEQDEQMGSMSLLMWATATQEVLCIQLLLRYGADPTLTNQGGVSALTIAQCRRGYEAITPLLEAAAKRPVAAAPRSDQARCRHLGLDESQVIERLERIEARRDKTRLDKFTGPRRTTAIESEWEYACHVYLLNRDAQCRDALTNILTYAEELFFGPHFDVPEAQRTELRKQIEWVPSLARSLAAAAVLGHWPTVDRLRTYPDKGCYRGEKSPTYGLEWYEWPLWRHLAAETRGEKPNTAWLRGMKKDSTRKSKAMLAAYEAIRDANSPAAQKAVKRIVEAQLAWQRKNWHGIVTDHAISAEATYFFHWARHESLDVTFADDWIPHVLRM